jgi:ABC-2 type transport system ATP-binding protein
VDDGDGPVGLVELADDGGSTRLLEAALERDVVHEFTKLRPSLAEIYREVTA